MSETNTMENLLALKALGSENGKHDDKNMGAMWAIFIIILIFAIIWYVKDSSKLLHGGGRRCDDDCENDRGRIKDVIDAEFFRKNIVTKAELNEEIRDTTLLFKESLNHMYDKSVAHAEKQDFKLLYDQSLINCTMNTNIQHLYDRKVDKEDKKVAFCATKMCGEDKLQQAPTK